MNKRRVVITGLGVVAPNGIGVDDFWKANIGGVSGIDTIASFDTSAYESKIAGIVKNFDPLRYMSADVAKRTDRFVHLGLASARMALDDSGLDLQKEDRQAIGVVIGSGLGGALFHEEQMMAALEKGVGRIHPLSVPRVTPNAVAGHIAIQSDLRGSNMAISTACASGTHAVGEAFRKVQSGELDMCLAGGAEAPLSRFTFGAYNALKVLSKRNDSPKSASRPFDKDRDGFVLAEGSAVLILEEISHAVARSARIYAEIIGYASSSGAYHMVMPQPDGLDAAAAIRSALKDAGLDPADIQYINAHGTSTQANDKAETKAIKDVFGDLACRVPISSTKSMIGHSIGAAGAIEALVCALAIKEGVAPPTMNLTVKDPDCDLDYVPNQARRLDINAALSNSFGFGSCNACIVFRNTRR